MATTFIPATRLRLRRSRPRAEVEQPIDAPWLHLVRGDKPLAFLVDGSRLFAVDKQTFALLEAGDAAALADLRGSLPPVEPRPLPSLTLRSLSLNLAQVCNLSCDYCYADEGRFGG